MKSKKIKIKRSAIGKSDNSYYLTAMELPKGFVQKPVYSYIPLKDTVKKSRFNHWVENMSYDYYIVHIEEKEYAKYVLKQLFNILAILVLFFCGLFFVYETGIFYLHSNDNNLKSTWFNNIFHFAKLNENSEIVADQNIHIQLIFLISGILLIIFSIIYIILYSYFISTFFNTSLLRFLESDEYKRKVEYFKNVDFIQQINLYPKRRMKRLLAMKFIPKNVFKAYVKNAKLYKAMLKNKKNVEDKKYDATWKDQIQDIFGNGQQPTILEKDNDKKTN